MLHVCDLCTLYSSSIVMDGTPHGIDSNKYSIVLWILS